MTVITRIVLRTADPQIHSIYIISLPELKVPLTIGIVKIIILFLHIPKL
jgi:hypothetical protein